MFYCVIYKDKKLDGKLVQESAIPYSCQRAARQHCPKDKPACVKAGSSKGQILWRNKLYKKLVA